MKTKARIALLPLVLAVSMTNARSEDVFEVHGVYSARWVKSAELPNNELRKFQVLEIGKETDQF